MPLFSEKNGVLQVVKPTGFKLEKELQTLVENNLEEIFSCKFVASEFSTGDIHSGRIDTLAISEEDNPVIIEYKARESSSLLNQSLFYLAWLQDHKGDFAMAVKKKFPSMEVDWSNIRIICIAPGYAKYDLHAVKTMTSAPIELWKYKVYENNMLNMEKIFGNDKAKSVKSKNVHTNVVVNETNEDHEVVSYTYEQHYNNLGNSQIKELIDEIRDYIISLNVDVEELPRKFYIAYKTSKNFCCIALNKEKPRMWLKFLDKNLSKYQEHGKDVTAIGHHGTGNFEIRLNEDTNMETLKEMIKVSFENIGG